jgi:hypothetical protein
MSDVWTWVKSINSSKVNLLETEDDIKQYSPFIINKSLSYHWDTVLLANELNCASHIPIESQYLFYLYAIKKGNRFSRWVKKESSENLELIKTYYKCSDAKAYEVLDLFSKEQITYIKNKLESCGLKK